MISREELDNLAVLARLKLTEREAEKLREDISSILGYVDQIASVSAEALEPQAPAHRNVLREDAPRAEGDPLIHKEEAVRKAFPRREKDFLVVRQILQKDE